MASYGKNTSKQARLHHHMLCVSQVTDGSDITFFLHRLQYSVLTNHQRLIRPLTLCKVNLFIINSCEAELTNVLILQLGR
jgi:hypothetical protein